MAGKTSKWWLRVPRPRVAETWMVEVAPEHYEHTVAMYCRAVVTDGSPVGRWEV